MKYHAETNHLLVGGRPARWMKRPNYQASVDAELAAAARVAIECLTTIPVETVQVTARNRWLHLEGTVGWAHQRLTLQELTRNQPGVRGVTDCIAIAP